MNESSYINLYGTVADSIVDGPGLRYAVFVQGCSHACPGCHNPESQPVEGGSKVDVESVVKDIQANKLTQGVTLSGGEPFDQPVALAELAQHLKGLGYNIWTYTGYLYEELRRRAETEPAVGILLDCTDVLVDGPFVQERKSLGLKWRGSSNQRVIDMRATEKAGRIVKWEAHEMFPVKPASW